MFRKFIHKILLSDLFEKLKRKLIDHPKIIGKVVSGENLIIREGTTIIVPNGSQLKIGNNCYIGKDVEIGVTSSITLGDNVSLQDRNVILGDVEIQSYCLFAPNVYISSGRHYYNLIPHWNIKDQDAFVSNDSTLKRDHSKKVIIEEDCWLGINVVIMSGVKLSKGCVIGSNSVVTKNSEPYTILGGSPAKVIKKRLEFNPPYKVDANKEEHLPYLYKGFYTNVKERSLSIKQHQGIRIKNNFSIALKNGQKINLTLKSNNGFFLINYQNQTKKFTSELETITFNCSDSYEKEWNIHDFCIERASENVTDVFFCEAFIS